MSQGPQLSISISGTHADAIDALRTILPGDALLTGEEEMARYSRDSTGDHAGRPLAVARPRTVGEVSALMRHCWQAGLRVVPQGGLTGLVGAAVAAPGEIVVSLERMSAVRQISPIDFAMVVEAGCILEDAKSAADAVDCLLPITFGAQGTCRVGGNVSTNAGGFNVLRYGMTRDLVLGLEVVLADGRVWNGLKVLRKDNRGYDLKQLFIGAEGTLGIVTAVAFKLFPKPTQVETALVGLASVEDAMELYARARRGCSDLLTAFELILRDGIEVALRARPDFPDPLSEVYPAYVLIEASGGGTVDLRGLMESFLGGADDIIRDGVIASSRAQAERLWLYRETMVEIPGPRRALPAHRRVGADLPHRRLHRRGAAGGAREARRGDGPGLWPCRRRQRAFQHHPAAGPGPGGDGRPVPQRRGTDLRRGRPAGRQHQRRARHRPGQAARLPGTDRPRVAGPRHPAEAGAGPHAHSQQRAYPAGRPRDPERMRR